MPLNDSGQYFSNPKQGAMHDTYDQHGQKSQPGHVEENGEAKPAVEVHKMPQGYKTISQAPDGMMDEQDHPDIHTALNHVMTHFGEAQDEASDQLDDNDAEDNSGDGMSSADVKSTDSGAY